MVFLFVDDFGVEVFVMSRRVRSRLFVGRGTRGCCCTFFTEAEEGEEEEVEVFFVEALMVVIVFAAVLVVAPPVFKDLRPPAKDGVLPRNWILGDEKSLFSLLLSSAAVVVVVDLDGLRRTDEGTLRGLVDNIFKSMIEEEPAK